MRERKDIGKTFLFTFKLRVWLASTIFRFLQRCQMNLRADLDNESKIPPNFSFHHQIFKKKVAIIAVFTENRYTLFQFEPSQWVKIGVLSKIPIFQKLNFSYSLVAKKSYRKNFSIPPNLFFTAWRCRQMLASIEFFNGNLHSPTVRRKMIVKLKCVYKCTLMRKGHLNDQTFQK